MGSKQKPKRSVIKLIDCEGLSNEYFPPYVYRIVYLSGFPREKEPIGYISMHIYEKRFIIGIGSHDYGGQKVPQYAICKLGTRKARGMIQSEFKDLRTGGADGISPGVEGQQTWSSNVRGRKRWMSQLKNRERENPLFPEFCFIWDLKRLEDACS